MLFVPSHVAKFVASARRQDADAYILDLEDGVPLAYKSIARTAIFNAATCLSRSGAAVLVRINREPTLVDDDLQVAVMAHVQALMLPKVESVDDVQTLDRRIGVLERERGLESGRIFLIAQIESVSALLHIDKIATSSARLMGLILGSEDFSASAGMEPTSETLYGPNQQLVFACRRAGILPFGFPGSISVFRDLKQLRALINQAREMGFVGSYAIHPNQVTVMNEAFAPLDEAVQHAHQLLLACESALGEGRGAFEFQGRMIDPPVVTRAREILRRHAVVTRLRSADALG